jgi:hypothetical protein
LTRTKPTENDQTSKRIEAIKATVSAMTNMNQESNDSLLASIQHPSRSLLVFRMANRLQNQPHGEQRAVKDLPLMFVCFVCVLSQKVVIYEPIGATCGGVTFVGGKSLQDFRS